MNQKSMIVLLGAMSALGGFAADDVSARVNLKEETRAINPYLHCAGFSPTFYTRAIKNRDPMVTDLNLKAVRTHDWALVHNGQRIIDTHFIFPLMKLDPKDPSNYYFEATDRILELAREMGPEVFYRIGPSIEHTGPAGHFNTRVPDDFDKYAEVCAGIVRHYTKGWGNGYNWDIKHWEIWNEPDCQSDLGNRGCWGQNHEDSLVLREKFCKFFVTVLKRLKSEFPDLKVGGPAMGGDDKVYLTALLTECKKAGVAPDFISWHYYGHDPDDLAQHPKRMRKWCDELGFTKTQLIINEWHYLLSWDGIQANATPEAIEKAKNGPTGMKNIDSAVFNLAIMTKWQNDGVLDQAYYYGLRLDGKNFAVLDEYDRPCKVYHSLKMMGDLIKGSEKLVKTESLAPHVETLAAVSKDKKTAYVLLTDYRGGHTSLTLDVPGSEKAKRVNAYVLDHTHDYISTRVVSKDGRITVQKKDKNSAAFLIKIEF